MCFEGVYYTKIRRLLKILIKRRKKFIKFKKTQIWVFLKPNYPISKKSKNSRMGKGKGSFLRWVTKLNRGFMLIEFSGLSFWRIKKINKSLIKILGSPTHTLNKNNIFSY